MGSIRRAMAAFVMLAAGLACVRNASASISVSSACSGAGFSGTLTSGSTTVYFQSCPSSGDWNYRVWSAGGNIL